MQGMANARHLVALTPEHSSGLSQPSELRPHLCEISSFTAEARAFPGDGINQLTSFNVGSNTKESLHAIILRGRAYAVEMDEVETTMSLAAFYPRLHV